MSEAYTPNLSLLSKSGVSLVPFHPDADLRDSLLHLCPGTRHRNLSPLLLCRGWPEAGAAAAKVRLPVLHRPALQPLRHPVGERPLPFGLPLHPPDPGSQRGGI